MATQTIQFRSPPSQTITLRLFVAGSDTQIASAAATEATNRKGTYTAAFTNVPAAEYQYIATIGTSPIIPVASGYVKLTLTTATFQTYDAAKAVNLSEVPSPDAAVIAEAVAQYDQRDEQSTPGTIGWYFKKLRQASNTVEAVVTNDITPTATTFSVALTTYPTGAFTHAVLAVVEDGSILDQNSPILTYTNNTTYSTIVLEEGFTSPPTVGDVMLINVVSHVHSVASIADGVWGATSAAYSAATGTFGYLLNVINSAISSLSSLIQGSTVLTVASPNVRGNLVLTQGDTYDGLTGSNPKAQWTVTTDYTDGWAVTLTIRDKDDAVVYTRAGSVDSATVVSVPINVPTVSPFEGCPGVWQGKYDVQLTKSASIKTIAIGVVYINEDQTR